jgi:tRNA pseudouridine55 synthase
MDGLLVIDKPRGPTSHDVVARMRRVLRERRIGHTGTLDPLATGVLPLVVGKATRLARFLSGRDKQYEAAVRLGFSTDTGDADGSAIGLLTAGPWPTGAVIESALDSFRGQFLQTPPVFSAKKIAGVRSYDVARTTVERRTNVGRTSGPVSDVHRGQLAPVSVAVSTLDLIAVDDDRITLRLTCSAGFYVRALAQDLGDRLGTGAHLVALRRTAVGDLTVARALTLDAAERDPDAARAHLVPVAHMLADLPAQTLDADSVRRTVQGRDLESRIQNPESRHVRLLDETGDLVAIAEPSPTVTGFLHPSVVLR